MSPKLTQSWLHVAAVLVLAAPIVAYYYSWSSYNQQIARGVMSSPFIQFVAAVQGTQHEMAEWHRAHPAHWQRWAQVGMDLLPIAVVVALALEIFAWRRRRTHERAPAN